MNTEINIIIKELVKTCCEFKFDNSGNIEEQMKKALIHQSNVSYIKGRIEREDTDLLEAFQHITKLINEQKSICETK